MLYNVCSMIVGVLGLLASVAGLVVTGLTYKKAESIRDALNKQVQKQKIYPQLQKTIKVMKDSGELLKSNDPVNICAAISDVFENLDTLNTFNKDPEVGNIFSEDLQSEMDIVCQHLKECNNKSDASNYYKNYMEEYSRLRDKLDLEEAKRNVG